MMLLEWMKREKAKDYSVSKRLLAKSITEINSSAKDVKQKEVLQSVLRRLDLSG